MTKTYRQSKPLEDRVSDLEDRRTNRSSVTYTGDTTMSLADVQAGFVFINKATAVTYTLPQDSDNPSIQVGDFVDIYQLGAGAVTVAAGTGATLRKAGATAKILAQYGCARVRKIAANTYSLNGELAAS